MSTPEYTKKVLMAAAKLAHYRGYITGLEDRNEKQSLQALRREIESLLTETHADFQRKAHETALHSHDTE